MFTTWQLDCYRMLKAGKPFSVIQKHFKDNASRYQRWYPETINDVHQYAQAYRRHLIEKEMMRLRREVEEAMQ